MYPKSSKSITSRSSAILAEAMKSPKKDSYPRTPVKNKARKSTDVQEPKAESSFNPTPATDSSRMLKDNSNFVSESLFNQTIGAEHSSLSTINMPEDGKEAGLNMTPERYVKKLQEENAALRMELTEKNAMNTKLIKDNANLRHEMEQFLSTVNDAREYIDLELKECNQRIQDLEAEMQELRVENALYKEQLARQKESSRGKSLKMNEPPAQEVQGVYSNALKDVEDFYSKLNGQITDFLDNSKKQQQEFSKTIQSKMQESQVSVNELPKSSVSISTNYSPGRQVSRPKTPTSMTRADTFRIQGTMTPGRRNTMARKTLDNFVTKANEVNVSPSYRLVKGRAGHASSNQFELLGQEESMGSISQDLGRSKKSVASVVSPKTGLKTKLKSDIILQEMKKKLIS